jgi:hypothetical protein
MQRPDRTTLLVAVGLLFLMAFPLITIFGLPKLHRNGTGGWGYGRPPARSLLPNVPRQPSGERLPWAR